MVRDALPADRLPALDGVRGLAATVVLLHHCMLTFSQDTLPNALVFSPLHFFWAGTEAVVVFFILSGLVLTLPVLRRRPFDWVAYYPSRLIRLYVPVWASLALATVLALLIPRDGSAGDSLWLRQHHDQPTFAGLLRDGFLLTGVDRINGPLWSLQWEVLFSLLLPLYVLVAVRFRRFWWVLVLVILGLDPLAKRFDATWWTYLATFMLGVVLMVRWDLVTALTDRINALRLRNVVWAALLVVALLGFTSAWWVRPLRAGIPTGSGIFIPLSAAAFLLIAIGWVSAKKLLLSRTVQWLGGVSFSLYVTHEPLIVGLAHVFSPPALHWLIWPVGIGGSLLIAWGFSKAVEQPSHRLSQRVRRLVAERRPRPVAERG